jgi:hypothetical protein
MMSNLDDRIAQFEKMCNEDPSNDMAHFSLGGACNQAGRFADAAKAFSTCFALNPGFSKAYQLAGTALMACQDTEQAKKVLLDGFHVAATKGDLMPKNAIAELLQKLGEPVPEIESEGPAIPEGSFMCQVTGKPGHEMTRPPFKGPVGAWIHERLRRDLPGVDRAGHQGHQRASARPLQRRGRRGLRRAHARVPGDRRGAVCEADGQGLRRKKYWRLVSTSPVREHRVWVGLC